MGDAAQARPQFIHITNNGAVNNLRELVRTHVILAPGACGREVPSGSPWTGSAGSARSAGSAGSADGIIFSRFRHKQNNENENPISKL